jgi:hypothetical protein
MALFDFFQNMIIDLNEIELLILPLIEAVPFFRKDPVIF